MTEIKGQFSDSNQRIILSPFSENYEEDKLIDGFKDIALIFMDLFSEEEKKNSAKIKHHFAAHHSFQFWTAFRTLLLIDMKSMESQY